MKSTAKLRSLMLPLSEMNVALPMTGIIIEIGSGWGSLAAYLAEAAPQRIVIGIDTDQRKLTQAQKKYQLPNLQFKLADAQTYDYKLISGAVLSDFLHHVPYRVQEKILVRLARSIKKNGILMIKEIDRQDGLLMLLSRIWDFLLYPGDKIYYRSRAELLTILSGLGFSVTVKRAVHRFPGSTHLYVCIKK